MPKSRPPITAVRLIDLQGRVMGVLVPMSPQETSEMAGVEWYDSGIGFAVPLEHINRVLPRLKKGEDLNPGLARRQSAPRRSLCRSADYCGEPSEIARRAGRSEIGRPHCRNQWHKSRTALSEMRHQLGPLYAGEKVTVVVAPRRPTNRTLRRADCQTADLYSSVFRHLAAP